MIRKVPVAHTPLFHHSCKDWTHVQNQFLKLVDSCIAALSVQGTEKVIGKKQTVLLMEYCFYLKSATQSDVSKQVQCHGEFVAHHLGQMVPGCLSISEQECYFTV